MSWTDDPESHPCYNLFMRYERIKKAIFIERKNRFVARVFLDGKEETVHVKNTGRCKELLIPGASVYLEESVNPARLTKYDLIAVEKVFSGTGETVLVNMDSLAPNKVAAEWIRESRKYFPVLTKLKSEYALGDSRFDFYAEYQDENGKNHKKLIEVKGCTLERDAVALFPDAPTQRGLKHVRELTSFQASGEYECMILILVQMTGCRYFSPNRETQPSFADALVLAKEAGVDVLAIECLINPESMEAAKEIEVGL